MEANLAQPYEHLVQMLATFAASARCSQPSGPSAARWARVASQLEQELTQLRAVSQAPPHAGADQVAAPAHLARLQSTATRLTQLARTHDGLRLEQSAATPPAQLAAEQRLVVFAAWQLMQAIEQPNSQSPLQTQAAQR